MPRGPVSRLRSHALWALRGRRALGLALVGWLSALATPALAAPAKKPVAKAQPSKGKPGKGPAKNVKGGKHPRPVMQERRVAATKGGQPNVQALGALVLDENGHELFSRNPDKERPIASVSKLAAVLVVMDRGLELDGLTTIVKADTEVARGGARSRLLEGLTVSNRDLLHAALLGSDNRAVPALGRAVKLTPSQLAAAMTAKAKELGLAHTRFHDPTGLSPENVSTPRDTIAMLKAVMKHPVLSGITHRITYDAHPVGRPAIVYNNTYKPAIRPGIEVIAGKTGYNDEARYCLVIATRIGGQTYFMSFLSNEGKLTRFGDVARVADWIVQHRAKTPGSNEAVASAKPSPATAPATGDKSEVASARGLPPQPAVPVKAAPVAAPAPTAPATFVPVTSPDAPASTAPASGAPASGPAPLSPMAPVWPPAPIVPAPSAASSPTPMSEGVPKGAATTNGMVSAAPPAGP